MTDSCFACDLVTGRVVLPGGQIHRTDHWIVEHCVGPLGIGTLVVKPERHVLHVADLDEAEAQELGPLLLNVSRVLTHLCQPDQIYTCLWSHAGRQPVHIHFVVQPVSSSTMEHFDAAGPSLQVAMFADETPNDLDAVEAFAERARVRFAAGQ